MSRTTMIPLAILAALCGSAALAAGNPLKVYILAGQSNMQGSAHKRTFAALGDDPKTAALLTDILDPNGDPLVCDNAWITYQTRAMKLRDSSGSRAGTICATGTISSNTPRT